MKKLIGLLAMAWSCMAFGCSNAMTQDGYLNGFPAKLTFHVTDSRGNPVSNATVTVFYKLGENDYAGNDFHGLTDTNGIFSVEGKVTSYAQCSFEKEGYYRSTFHHKFLTAQCPNPP